MGRVAKTKRRKFSVKQPRLPRGGGVKPKRTFSLWVHCQACDCEIFVPSRQKAQKQKKSSANTSTHAQMFCPGRSTDPSNVFPTWILHGFHWSKQIGRNLPWNSSIPKPQIFPQGPIPEQKLHETIFFNLCPEDFSNAPPNVIRKPIWLPGIESIDKDKNQGACGVRLSSAILMSKDSPSTMTTFSSSQNKAMVTSHLHSKHVSTWTKMAWLCDVCWQSTCIHLPN